MPDNPTTLATPDPILTTESAGTFGATLVADVYVLFGSNMTNEKQTAVAGLITGAWIIFTLVHSAVVRRGRALGNAQK